MRWTPGPKRPTSLNFLPLCSEGDLQEQEAWDKGVQREGEQKSLWLIAARATNSLFTAFV